MQMQCHRVCKPTTLLSHIVAFMEVNMSTELPLGLQKYLTWRLILLYNTVHILMYFEGRKKSQISALRLQNIFGCLSVNIVMIFFANMCLQSAVAGPCKLQFLLLETITSLRGRCFCSTGICSD